LNPGRKRDLPEKTNTAHSADAAGYGELLEDLKARIRNAQVHAAVTVNRELVHLYWQIGREILVRQQAAGWGAKVVDRLSTDLRREFPEMSGLSRTNLLYMRAFAGAYPDESIVPQAVGQIPWGHNRTLLDKLNDAEERVWYAENAVQHGWSRAVLVHHIESGLHARKGRAITNFKQALPQPQSDLARHLLKDPYHFDFLTLGPDARERDLEHRLDLLFYHLTLRCFIVIDLKVGPFQPEYAGKVNFYLSAVDDLLRQEGDQPSIGLILCKERNRVVVEYALRGASQPIGVAEYRLTVSLPQDLRQALPSPEELERELRDDPGPEA